MLGSAQIRWVQDPTGARVRGAISKSGGNASLAGVELDKRNPKRARSRKRRRQPREELSRFTVKRQPEGRVSTASWNLKGLRRSTGR